MFSGTSKGVFNLFQIENSFGILKPLELIVLCKPLNYFQIVKGLSNELEALARRGIKQAIFAF